MSILGVVQKVLNRNEIISGNNALVVIPVKALGAVPPILSGLVVQIVGGEGLPGQHIPAMRSLRRTWTMELDVHLIFPR